VTTIMDLFQKMSSSLPDKWRHAPSSRLTTRQSIALRNVGFFQIDARVGPAHDGVRAS